MDIKLVAKLNAYARLTTDQSAIKVIDSLDSISSKDALAARQGTILKLQIEELLAKQQDIDVKVDDALEDVQKAVAKTDIALARVDEALNDTKKALEEVQQIVSSVDSRISALEDKTVVGDMDDEGTLTILFK